MDTPLATREELLKMQAEEERLSRWVRRLSIADIALVVPMVLALMTSLLLNEDENLAGALSGLTAILFLVVHVLGGLYYWRWLRSIIVNERALFGPAFVKQPSAVVWAYVIPFANLVRPYQLLEYIYNWSDPSDLPRPPRREIDAQNYREAPLVEARERARWKLPFPLAAWWIIRCLDTIINRVAPDVPEMPIPDEKLAQMQLIHGVSAAFSVAEVVLFLVVFRALAARRTERFHRLIGQHNP